MSGSGIDENKRLPMLWSGADASAQCNPPAAADQPQRLKEGVAEQDNDPASLLNWYRQVIALRNLAPVLARGTMTALDAGNKAVAFYRVDGGDQAVAVLVNSSASETFSVNVETLSDAEFLGFCGNTEAFLLQEMAGCVTMVTLPPVSCVLLTIK